MYLCVHVGIHLSVQFNMYSFNKLIQYLDGMLHRRIKTLYLNFLTSYLATLQRECAKKCLHNMLENARFSSQTEIGH